MYVLYINMETQEETDLFIATTSICKKHGLGTEYRRIFKLPLI